MKSVFSILALLAGLSFNAQARTVPELVDANFKRSYIPVGFDSNDNSQIVAEGEFPNTCYRPADVRKVVNHEKMTIHLYPKAYFYSGMCLQVIVPYHREVDLGPLREGTYQVYNVTGKEVTPLGNVRVNRATNDGPDDFFYAPVAQTYLDKRDDKSFITVTGSFMASCYKVNEVRVRVDENIMIVQPIAEKTEVPCQDVMTPFKEVVEIPNPARGRYLIHVRSLNGRAVNSLVDVE